MIRRFYSIVLLLLLTSMPGCAACNNSIKGLKSGTFGLHKKITLYGTDGKEIRSWETRAAGIDHGGTYFFLDANGKAITLSGTFVIEEK